MKKKLALVACVWVVASVLAPPLPAAKGQTTWWFQRKNTLSYTPWRDQIKPLSGVPSVVTSGVSDGKPWYVVAYIAKPPFDHGRESVIVMKLLGSLSSNPAGSSGTALYGMPQPAWVTAKGARDLQSWFGFGDSPIWSGGPWLMSGQVARGVDRLVVVSKPDGSGKQTTTVVPLKQVAAVGYGARVFAFPFYPFDRIDMVSAYSSSGKLLDRIKNTPHASGP